MGKQRDDDASVYAILADIREKSGVGVKPMLSELADTIAAEIASLRQQLAASQAREAEAYERAAKATCSGCASEVPINEDGYHQHGSFTFPCHATAIRALAGREG